MNEKWRTNLRLLNVAVERLVNNFSINSGVARKVAAGHIERIAKEIREKEERKG